LQLALKALKLFDHLEGLKKPVNKVKQLFDQLQESWQKCYCVLKGKECSFSFRAVFCYAAFLDSLRGQSSP
jgi:hypothetical protein